MKLLRKIQHRLAHWTGMNGGHVDSGFEDNGDLWIGFRCKGCGEVSGRFVAIQNGEVIRLRQPRAEKAV